MKIVLLMLLMVFTSSCASWTGSTANPPNLLSLEQNTFSLVVELNKEIDLEKSYNNLELYAPTIRKTISGESLGGTKYKFSLPYLSEKNKDACYKLVWSVVAIQKYSSVNNHAVVAPKGKDDWCLKLLRHDTAVRDINNVNYLERNLHNLRNKVLRLNSIDENFSEECRNPKPIAIPQPEAFCSNSSELEKRKNHCEAPVLKRGCRYTLDELVNASKAGMDKSVIPLACISTVNSLMNKETSLDEIIFAYSQRAILSKMGKIGTLVSYASPALQRNACLSNIESACNPTAELPQSCTAWGNHKLEKAKIQSELLSLQSEVRAIRDGLKSARHKTIIQKF